LVIYITTHTLMFSYIFMRDSLIKLAFQSPKWEMRLLGPSSISLN